MARDETARPQQDGLLAHLYRRGLIPQAEVAVTQSIAWLCSLSGNNPLHALIRDAGLMPHPNSTWEAEVRAHDGTRTDLECRWGNPPRTHVVVEAKLGALLTVEQVSGYARDLQRRLSDDDESRGAPDGNRGLVVVLVPEHRTQEAADVLNRSVSTASGVLSAVWSYEDVLTALQGELGDSGDLIQLGGLVKACEALDVRPFTEAEIAGRAPERQQDLMRLVDAATAAQFADGARVQPSRQDDQLVWLRYIEVTPGGTNIAVGITRPDVDVLAESWIWVRVHKATSNAASAAELLRGSFPSGQVHTDSVGHTWMPLAVPLGVAGAAATATLIEKIGDVLTAVREPSAAGPSGI